MFQLLCLDIQHGLIDDYNSSDNEEGKSYLVIFVEYLKIAKFGQYLFSHYMSHV